MLYPLSYEGLRPLSYRPGDAHECPGVPWGAQWCYPVYRWGFRRWSEDVRSEFRARAARRVGDDRVTPSVDLWCHPLAERIRSTRGVI